MNTVYVIFPTHNKAFDWLKLHYGNTEPLVVEHRYIEDIVNAMAEDGIKRNEHYILD